MKHSVPHGLGVEAARKAARAAFAAYAARFERYRPTATWTTDDRAEVSFTVKGVTLRGSIEIRPASIDLDLEVPFLLRPFKDQALGAVEREIGAWVGKAQRGEL